MADDKTTAPTDEQKKLFKEWMKEAISEWNVEETTRRTEEAAKNKKTGGGLFDSLFG